MDLFVRDFIVPIAQKRGWRRFCEIGVSQGTSTDQLLRLYGISHTIVDPGLDADLDAKYASDRRVRVLRDLSLAALPNMQGPYDCFLIDGDHNWFTVFNELNLIHQRRLLRPGGMIFFHDVDWSYGRRDMYYQSETVPAQYRLEFQRKGILRGQNALADSGGRNPTLVTPFTRAARETACSPPAKTLSHSIPPITNSAGFESSTVLGFSNCGAIRRRIARFYPSALRRQIGTA